MRFQSIPKIAQFICTLLVVYMAFYGIAQATMAPAGIDINNTATSEYINDRGQNKTTESNTVTIKVLPVFSATLTPAPDAIGSPNQIIKWLHTLTKIGRASCRERV